MTLLESTLADMARRFGELDAIDENWDSYGGRPPTKASLKASRAFVRDVLCRVPQDRLDGARPFAIVPLVDGGVQLEWRAESAEIELDIGPDGEFGYLLIDKTGDERRFEEGDDITPDEALALVASVLGLG
jgi:hypothetical protein